MNILTLFTRLLDKYKVPNPKDTAVTNPDVIVTEFDIINAYYTIPYTLQKRV